MDKYPLLFRFILLALICSGIILSAWGAGACEFSAGQNEISKTLSDHEHPCPPTPLPHKNTKSCLHCCGLLLQQPSTTTGQVYSVPVHTAWIDSMRPDHLTDPLERPPKSA